VGTPLPRHRHRTPALQGDRRAAPAHQRIQSRYDPDARYSTKRDTEWVGAKAHLQNVLTGIALNVLRLGAWFDPHPTTKRRSTRIHALCTAHSLAAA